MCVWISTGKNLVYMSLPLSSSRSNNAGVGGQQSSEAPYLSTALYHTVFAKPCPL